MASDCLNWPPTPPKFLLCEMLKWMTVFESILESFYWDPDIVKGTGCFYRPCALLHSLLVKAQTVRTIPKNVSELRWKRTIGGSVQARLRKIWEELSGVVVRTGWWQNGTHGWVAQLDQISTKLYWTIEVRSVQILSIKRQNNEF